jgi:hypothetical protein
MSQKVPNPNGKKGGKDHQDKIDEVAEEIQNRGLRVRFEKFIEVLNGIKN